MSEVQPLLRPDRRRAASADPPMWSPETREDEAPFYQAPGYSPDATRTELALQFAKVTVNVFEQGERKPVSLDRLVTFHRHLFRPFFREDVGAGRFRHDWEGVSFGTWVEVEPDWWEMRGVSGAPMGEARARLRAACEPFEPAVGRVPAVDPVRDAAELLTEVVLTHPFVDGNLRAGVIAMQAGLHYYGLEPVVSPLTDIEFVRALSFALRPDKHRTVEPLVAATRERVGRDAQVVIPQHRSAA